MLRTRSELHERADLTAVADWQSTLTTFAHQLDHQYQETNLKTEQTKTAKMMIAVSEAP